MFGILRTTLALMVMVYHLFIGLLQLGTYAVFGFYIVSGYLMTLIMHESYGYNSRGRRAFAVNRCLRLYPQYWAAAAVSVLLVLALGPDVVSGYHKSIVLPTTSDGFVSNILMAFPAWHPNQVNPRLVPPAWALTVEIFFYVLICLGLSKSFLRVKWWLVLSVGYVVFTFAVGWPMSDRYFPVAAASLPFSIGAAVYFMSGSRRVAEIYSKLRVSSAGLFVAMLANCLFWMIMTRFDIGELVDIGFYVNILICALLVYGIVRGEEILKINRSLDRFIGDFSYPMYLLHWQVGLFVSYLVFGEALSGFSVKGLACLVISIAVVCALSLVFGQVIDQPVQRLRARIKAATHQPRSL